jgi:hypothetical protein
LRGDCGVFQGFPKTVHRVAVPPRDKFPVYVDRHLNGTLPGLILGVYEAISVLDQQGLPEIAVTVAADRMESACPERPGFPARRMAPATVFATPFGLGREVAALSR